MLEQTEDGKLKVNGYGFTVGKIPRLPYWLLFLVPRSMRDAMRILAGTEGLIGVCPIGDRTLCVYDTLNNAKRARNILESEGIAVYSKEIHEIDTVCEKTAVGYA